MAQTVTHRSVIFQHTKDDPYSTRNVTVQISSNDMQADRIDIDLTVGDEYAVVTVDAHIFQEAIEGLFYRRECCCEE